MTHPPRRVPRRMTRRIGLDWDDRAHWGGGRRLPCHLCGRLAFLRDEQGRPCHKTCAETALTQIPADSIDGRYAA
ncbi:hypothetical protein ACSNOI_29970 [Actinomadura kijaniata]|uniref:hypothetical protein n=1 Tax=Actinomadura kijaniata TaxID=46161 RepID=UPI003F1B0CD3